MNRTMPPLSSEGLLALLHSVPVGIAVLDKGGKIDWCNLTLTSQLGLPEQEILGRNSEELPMVRDDDGLFHLPDAVEGTTEWLARLSCGLEEGEALIFVDVTESENSRIHADRLRQALLGQSSTDHITGLLNRKAVMHQLESQISRSRRYGNPLSVMVMRICCSGGAAEKVARPILLTYSRMLRDQTRWPDIIGRWSEHEFLLVLPETTEESATALGSKIRKQITGLSVDGQEIEEICETSYGISEWRQKMDAMGLVKRAMSVVEEIKKAS